MRTERFFYREYRELLMEAQESDKDEVTLDKETLLSQARSIMEEVGEEERAQPRRQSVEAQRAFDTLCRRTIRMAEALNLDILTETRDMIGRIVLAGAQLTMDIRQQAAKHRVLMDMLRTADDLWIEMVPRYGEALIQMEFCYDLFE